MSYEPVTEVIISHKDIQAAIEFWELHGIAFVRIPGMREVMNEIMAKPTISLDDQERMRYLICYEISHNGKCMLQSTIQKCKEVVAAMDLYYPGRIWI